MPHITPFFTTTLSVGSLSSLSLAATIQVTTTAAAPDFNDNLCGLNEAVQAANADLNFSGCVRTGTGSDDTIVLGTDEYGAAEIIVVTSNITLVGQGPGDTTIDAAAGVGFWTQSLGGFEPDLVVNDVTLRGFAGDTSDESSSGDPCPQSG